MWTRTLADDINQAMGNIGLSQDLAIMAFIFIGILIMGVVTFAYLYKQQQDEEGE